MKRLFKSAGGVLLAVLLLTTAYAASGDPAKSGQVKGGEKSGRSSSKSWHDQEKKRRAHQKLAAELRQQELSRDRVNEDPQPASR